jgi:hypothetical protein
MNLFSLDGVQPVLPTAFPFIAEGRQITASPVRGAPGKILCSLDEETARLKNSADQYVASARRSAAGIT